MAQNIKPTPDIRWDIALCLIILAHMATAYGLSLVVGDARWFNVLPSGQGYLTIALFYCAICLAYGLLKGLFTRNLRGVLGDFFNARLLVGVVMFGFIGLMMGSFHSIKIMMPELVPFTWDTLFADLDKAIHFGDPWVYLTGLDKFYYPMTFFYVSVWFTLHLLLTFCICISGLKIRAQYLYTYVSTWLLCGNVIPMAFMAAGPIYYQRLTGSDRFAELSQRIFAAADERYPQSLIPETLWQSYVEKNPFTGSGISAFPSLHVAMAMLVFLVACQYGKILGSLAFAFLLFTLVASVNLGWHYAVDGYASIVLVPIIWMVWGRYTSRASHGSLSRIPTPQSHKSRPVS